MSTKRLLAALALLWVALPAHAQGLIFERENIRIESPAGAPAADGKPRATHAPLTFDVEVRPEDALRLEYIHTLNALADNSGVVIAFAAPTIVSLPALKVPTPVDTLFVAENGMIIQILPNTVLADLTQEIVAHKPIKAFVFLKAGTVKAQEIKPQDIIRGSTFSAAPPVME